MIARIFAVAVLLIAANAAAQQAVYKSIDANGHVTYSSTPPPGAARAETVELTPPPAPTDVQAARERAQAVRELNDQTSREREQRSAQAAEERQQAARQQAAEPPPDAAYDGGYGWGRPVYPGRRPGRLRPGVRPPWWERPVPPPPTGSPGARPDHPAYWPRGPAWPPDTKPSPPGRLNSLPPPRSNPK